MKRAAAGRILEGARLAPCDLCHTEKPVWLIRRPNGHEEWVCTSCEQEIGQAIYGDPGKAASATSK